MSLSLWCRVCGIAKQGVRVLQVLYSGTERPPAREVTDTSVRERAASLTAL